MPPAALWNRRVSNMIAKNTPQTSVNAEAVVTSDCHMLLGAVISVGTPPLRSGIGRRSGCSDVDVDAGSLAASVDGSVAAFIDGNETVAELAPLTG